MLLDRRLESRPVLLRAIDSRTVSYVDSKGLLRAEPLTEILAILPAPPSAVPAFSEPARSAAPADAEPDPAAAPEAQIQAPLPVQPQPAARTPPAVPRDPSTIDLVDGQRLVGTILDHAAPEEVHLLHARLGELSIRFDDVQRVRVGQPQGTPPLSEPLQADAAGDTVLLANGDRVTGLVERLTSSLTLSTASNPSRELPLDRVREIVLSNPPKPATGMMVWLSDGTIVRARDIRTSRLGELEILPASGKTTGDAAWSRPMRVADLRGVAIDAQSLLPLARIAAAMHEPIDTRRWAPPPRVIRADQATLGLADIELSGPLRVSWPVPGGAKRFATRVELPRSAWVWGRCVVRVLADDKELSRHDLSGNSPAATIGVDVERARRLTVEILPADLGPVQNTVVLRAALFMIR